MVGTGWKFWWDGGMNAGLTLVENMAEKNRNRFPIAVLLTTMVCSHYMTTKFYYLIMQLQN